MRWSWKGGVAAVLALSCAFATGGAAAWAMVAPTSSGPIDGCYNTNRGTVRLLVAAGDTCDGRETAISFLGALAKAVDADKLDGLDSSAFYRSGSTVANALALRGHAPSAFLGTTIYAVTKGVAGGLPDSAVTATVACLPGDRALAGGFSDLDRTTFVEASRPGTDGSSWSMKWWNGAVVDALTLWVSCSQART